MADCEQVFDVEAVLNMPTDTAERLKGLRNRPRHSSAFQDAVEIQRILKEDALDPAADRRERAYSALAWERLEERKRILKNRGLPKAVDVSKLGKRARGKASIPADPVEPGPVEPAK